MRVHIGRALTRTAIVVATAAMAWAVLQPVAAAQRGSSPAANRVVAALQATSALQALRVASFRTTKTFTIEDDGEIRAQLVAALRYTAPDSKAFAVLGTRGSAALRGRVFDSMMATEVEATGHSRSSSVAITTANYEFTSVSEEGQAFVIDVVPRRREDLLFKGRIWISKEGLHLLRIEGQPATNLSFWTRRIDFVSEYAPVNGVWLPVRTVAKVKVRWFGDYVVRSECGPYDLVLADSREAGSARDETGGSRE